MRILEWQSLDASARSAALARPAKQASAQVCKEVQEIIATVRRDGDAALRSLTSRFDQVDLGEFAVSAAEIAAARRALTPEQHAALERAIANVHAFHAAQRVMPLAVETVPGVRCERVIRPIGAVGLYAPAGSAPLFSTVVMLAVPARIAGCLTRVLCTPPDRHGAANSAILVAAELCGVRTIFKIGGAQAIAALAYGTATIPKVDKIFGPGNVWVTAAKQMVASDPEGAACDLPAGPSEVLIVADDSARPDIVAADLLAQAEHGRESQAILVTPSATFAQAVVAAVAAQCVELSRRTILEQSLSASRCILVADLGVALKVANDYAPEHLILAVREPRRWLAQVQNAGSVFLGPWSSEALGDYCSGTNHVLPTYGYARAYSGLSVLDFVKRITVQEISVAGLRDLGPTAVTLAELEGLDGHARSVTRRLEILEGSATRMHNHMSWIERRARPDIVALAPYQHAAWEPQLERLHANELPWRQPRDITRAGLNHYPQPQPEDLIERLAALYEVAPECLLVTRGSDEAIDLLVRAFCRAGADAVIVCPPTFGMYTVAAAIQGAQVVNVPLRANSGFDLDEAALLEQCTDEVKLAFLCSPNNPTGNLLDEETMLRIARHLDGRALLVVDEAYIEFAGAASLARHLRQFPQLAVLRTLSKAHGLAGARCGALIAAPEVIALLRKVISPYALPQLTIECVLGCLESSELLALSARVAAIQAERERVTQQLRSAPAVAQVFTSASNFVLVDFWTEEAATHAFNRACAAGLLVRDVRRQPSLARALRITIGTPHQNDRLLEALQ
jgi:histidinol-phosphate aminotransferase